MKADTYEGPHLQICKCGMPPNPHYYLVDELDQRICPIPLLTQGMVREAIAKYGNSWNGTVQIHLEGNLAGSGLPERLLGMEYQSLDDAIAEWTRSQALRGALGILPVIGIEIDESGAPTGNGFAVIPLLTRAHLDS